MEGGTPIGGGGDTTLLSSLVLWMGEGGGELHLGRGKLHLGGRGGGIPVFLTPPYQRLHVSNTHVQHIYLQFAHLQNTSRNNVPNLPILHKCKSALEVLVCGY